MSLRPNKIPLRLVTVYATVSTLWIVGSDTVVSVTRDLAWSDWLLNTGKGLAFVGVTSALLYGLSRRYVGAITAAQDQLEESELRLKLALEASGDGFWDWNLKTDAVIYSPRAKAIFGYDESAFRPHVDEWQERIHPDDRAAVQLALERHLSGATETYVSEHRIRTADGSYRWALGRGKVVSRDGTGTPLRMIGLVSDASRWHEVQDRLTEALALSEAMLRAAPFGIVAYDEAGRTIAANEAAARAVGTTKEALLQQNFRTIANWRTHGLLEKAEEALRTKANVRFNTRYRSSFDREVEMEGLFAPFSFHHSDRLLLVFRDQTEQRRTSDFLNLLQSAIQAADQGWVVSDTAGTILWVNPGFTRLTGYTAEEAIGNNPRILQSGRHDRSFYAQMWETITRGAIWSGELENRRKDGAIYNQHMTIVPVRAEDGRITSYVAITQNVTHERQLEAQVQRTQRTESIGMLASGIAHDLNNILTPILMSIELLKDELPNATSRRRIGVVEAAALRGAAIVRQVLTFARGQDGERIELQPRQLLRDINHLLEETFPREIAIRLDVPAEVSPILGDPTHLHQVLLNLAVNARDAMPAGGTLTFGASDIEVDEALRRAHPTLQTGPHVAITVADTGAGITPEVQEHIFEPFFSTKVRDKGTGLGLSTVYGLVRSHRGVIEVRSTPGSGARFTILLPAAKPAPPDSDVAVGLMKVIGNNRVVLLVDDEPAIRGVAAHLLERRGFQVEAFKDGQDCWERFQVQPTHYAVAIVDMMMPRMNGPALITRIHLLNPKLPVIACSGLVNAAAGEGIDALLTGGRVGAVLRKPFTEHQLLQALTAVLPATES